MFLQLAVDSHAPACQFCCSLFRAFPLLQHIRLQLGNYHLKRTWCYSRAALSEAFNTYRRNNSVPLYFQVRKVDGNATMFCLIFSEGVLAYS